jgi:uncharacterized protein
MSIPLNDDELDDIWEFLDSLPDAMSIEMMDGFFAALVCSPDLIMPSSYFKYVWGDDHEFETIEEAEKYASLVLRHWNSISQQLRENDVFDPVMIETEDHSTGNEWAVGFMKGFQLGGDEWNDYLDDEENAGVFVPILMLAHENDPDPEMRPEPIDDEQRDKLLAGIAVGVPLMYKYMAPFRASGLPRHEPIETFKRTTRKIGRNESCPCGSGLKYKRCCGKN